MDNQHKKDNIENQLTAPARIFSRRKASLSEEIRRAERLHSLRNAYIADLLATIGNETYPDYARVRAETRRKLRSLPKSTFVNLNDLSGENSAQSEISAESQQLIASLGINGEKVKEIQRTYTGRVRLELESPPRDKKDVPVLSREAADMFMALNATPIPNVTFSSVVTSSFDEGTPNAWRHIALASADFSTQNLDTECRIAIGNATDNEFAITTAEAGLITDFFTVPSAGKVAVWVALGARDIVHRGFAVNEWGVSSLFGWTEIRCFVRLWHIGGLLDEMGGVQTFHTTAVYEPGGTSSWDIVLINPGDQRSFLFTSSRPWLAGDSVEVDVGVEQFTAAWSDDVTYQADVTSNWTISGISLQVVP